MDLLTTIVVRKLVLRYAKEVTFFFFFFFGKTGRKLQLGKGKVFKLLTNQPLKGILKIWLHGDQVNRAKANK